MTQVGTSFQFGTNGGYTGYIAAFKLASAPGGAQTVIITPSVTSFMKANTVSYAHVTSLGTTATNFATSGTSLTLNSVSSAANHMVTQCFFNWANTSSLSAYNQTSRWNDNTVWRSPMLIGDAAGAASVSFSATSSISGPWGAMAIDLT